MTEQQEFEEMCRLTAIDLYCKEYYRKNGRYLEKPTKEEILFFFQESKLFSSGEGKYHIKERAKRGETTELMDLFQPEDLYFQSGEDISVIISNRYFSAINHEHDYFEIECVLAGEAMQDMDFDRIILHEGDLVIVPPNTPHNLQPLGDSTIMNIGIRYSSFETAFRDILTTECAMALYFRDILQGNFLKECVLFYGGIDDTIRHLLIMLYRENHTSGLLSNKAQTHMVQSILYHLASESFEQSIFGPTKYRNDKMFRIRIYISEHLTDVSLDALGEEFGMSPAYISRYIYEKSGLKFSAMLQELRTEKAMALLRNSNKSISDIAAEVGYECESYFIKVFRRNTGYTPLQYRHLSLR